MSTHDLVGTLNSLLSPRQRKTLKAVESRGVLRGSRASVLYTPKGVQGGGIASPLTEQSYAEREWYAEKTLTSSDGLLSFRVQAIKQLRMTDANDAEVLLQFKEPTT